MGARHPAQVLAGLRSAQLSMFGEGAFSDQPGQKTFSRTDSGATGADDDLVTTVTGKTLYVDVTC